MVEVFRGDRPIDIPQLDVFLKAAHPLQWHRYHPFVKRGVMFCSRSAVRFIDSARDILLPMAYLLVPKEKDCRFLQQGKRTRYLTEWK